VLGQTVQGYPPDFAWLDRVAIACSRVNPSRRQRPIESVAAATAESRQRAASSRRRWTVEVEITLGLDARDINVPRPSHCLSQNGYGSQRAPKNLEARTKGRLKTNLTEDLKTTLF
jgi:hypothetical protein